MKRPDNASLAPRITSPGRIIPLQVRDSLILCTVRPKKSNVCYVSPYFSIVLPKIHPSVESFLCISTASLVSQNLAFPQNRKNMNFFTHFIHIMQFFSRIPNFLLLCIVAVVRCRSAVIDNDKRRAEALLIIYGSDPINAWGSRCAGSLQPPGAEPAHRSFRRRWRWRSRQG